MSLDSSKQKLAILLSRFPYPLEKGDKLRAYEQIKYLSQGFDIYLFCLEVSDQYMRYQANLAPYCKLITVYSLSKWGILTQVFKSFFRGEPIQVGYFFSDKIARQFQLDLDLIKPDVLYCQLSRTAKYGRWFNGYKVIDFQDAFSVNYQRIAAQSKGWLKWFYRRESASMKKFEQLMLTWYPQHTIISEHDQKAISPLVHVISNGVDLQKFHPIKTEKKFDLLFLGNLSYKPNKQAVFYLVEQILPELIKHLPHCRVNIVGANLPNDILKLKSKYVTISGWVDDITVAYNESKLFIAPLFSGAGLQNKVLESMSCGIPVITTTVVNASLKAIEGEEIIIANSPKEFIERITAVLSSPPEMERLSIRSREFVETNYRWETENEKLSRLLHQTN